VASADAGLDMVMPSSRLWGNLSTAVTNGTLSQDRLDDMATRYVSYFESQETCTNITSIVATHIKLGNNIADQGAGMPLNVSAPHQ